MRETKPLLFLKPDRRTPAKVCVTQTREQVKVFFKQSFLDDKLPTRYLIKAVYSRVCVFHRRGSELMELPKVWVQRLPARNKDRKLTSREEAYFARSWNKLEDGERKKKNKPERIHRGWGEAFSFPPDQMNKEQWLVNPPLPHQPLSIMCLWVRGRMGEGYKGLNCHPDLNRCCQLGHTVARCGDFPDRHSNLKVKCDKSSDCSWSSGECWRWQSHCVAARRSRCRSRSSPL